MEGSIQSHQFMKQRPNDLMGRDHTFDTAGCRCDIFAYVTRSGRREGYLSIWSPDSHERLCRLPIPGDYESLPALIDASRDVAIERLKNLSHTDPEAISGTG
jgi:hypothetical protein